MIQVQINIIWMYVYVNKLSIKITVNDFDLT